jgi:hypothetical protein
MPRPQASGRRVGTLLAALAVLFVTLTFGGSPAQAAGAPCDALPSPLAGACSITPLNGAAAVASQAGAAVDCATDPVGCVAKSFGQAAGWFMDKLATVITATTQVDMTNGGFLQLYTTMFGLAAVLTLLRVMFSVLTNVARGQGMEAVKAATGYYIAAVAVGAFAPAVVYVLLQLSDGLTKAVTLNTTDDTARFLTGVGKTMVAMPNDISAAVVLLVAVLMVISALVLWLELLLRAAAIYAVTLFATPVASGLINRNSWGSVRRWLNFLIALILAKPAVAAVLALAATLAAHGSTADAFSSVLVALALLVMAIFATALLFKFIPHLGDELAHVASARRELANAGPAAAIPGPASIVNRSINVHASNGGRSKGGSATRGSAAAAGPAAGAAAVVGQRVVRSARNAASKAGDAAAAATELSAPAERQNQGSRAPRTPAPPKTRGRDQ